MKKAKRVESMIVDGRRLNVQNFDTLSVEDDKLTTRKQRRRAAYRLLRGGNVEASFQFSILDERTLVLDFMHLAVGKIPQKGRDVG